MNGSTQEPEEGRSGHRVVVVGAGHAAAQLCVSLVRSGVETRITLVGDEPLLPYHRPPLSKTRLDPSDRTDPQLIQSPAFYEEHGITTIRGERATAIDREARTVAVGDRRLPYDTLVLATGSTHRRPPIPGIDGPSVHLLQTASHATALRDRAGASKRVVVIGGGFIGLEAAASLTKLGLAVTVVEAGDRVLGRVTAPPVSDFFAGLHRGHGVDLRLAAAVGGIEEEPGGGVSVLLGSGDADRLEADLVVVGVGATPNVELARDAGLAVDGGVLVDGHNRSETDPNVYAIGDCCRQHHPLYERRVRLESVQNATDQARTAAASIAAGLSGDGSAVDPPPQHAALPWFWSDQYDVKLQIAGLSAGYDRCVLRGDPASAPLSAWYFLGPRLIAVDAVNDARAYAAASGILPTRGTPDPAKIADTEVSIKDVLASAG